MRRAASTSRTCGRYAVGPRPIPDTDAYPGAPTHRPRRSNTPRTRLTDPAPFRDDQKWVVLYVKRWLTAPMQMLDGTVAERDRGTPQGSAVSPVLANTFMHYALDTWLEREFPTVEFERFADDAVVHCVTE